MRPVPQDAHFLGELVPIREPELLGAMPQTPAVAVADAQHPIGDPFAEYLEQLMLEHILDAITKIGALRDPAPSHRSVTVSARLMATAAMRLYSTCSSSEFPEWRCTFRNSGMSTYFLSTLQRNTGSSLSPVFEGILSG